MLHVRVVVPPDLASRIVDYLVETPSVINVVHHANAARKPAGDVISCDVAREEGSVVLSTLRGLGCATRGTIAAEVVDVSLSRAADDAERHAAGSPADAVLWEALSAQSSESADLSASYVLFMMLATAIAVVGLMTDSVVLIIGAMVVGPEFGPLAGVCVALLQRQWLLAMRSAVALGVGFAIAIVATALLVVILRAAGVAPAMVAHPQTMFVSKPDVHSALIAFIAGVAGMMSLTTSKPSALVGVFISVTTIPAAANIALAGAYQNASEARGAAFQLLLNVAIMVVAGLGTLVVQRLAFVRRWKAALRRRRRAKH